MKKTLLTVLVLSVMLIFTLPLFAELSVYAFTQTTATYTEITGGLLLGNESSDNQRFVNPAVPLGITTAPFTGPGLPIGFNFTFNDYVFDVIAINANGWISFGQSSLGAVAVDITSSSSYTPLSSTNTITPAQLFNRVAPFGRDIQAQAGASLRMETIGTAPNRTCVIQWKNYKRYGATGTGDILNFQIHLHETTNQVAFAYGAFTHGTTASTTYPQVGMRGPDTTDYLNRTTTTDWSATTAGTTSAATCVFATGIIPADGLVFEYTPPAAVNNDLQAMSISGNLTPIQGTPTVYTVTVRNAGSEPETTYMVKLMSGGTVLASVAGPTIQPEQILQVPITHSFATTGPLAVYGEVELATDLNPDNDDTNPINVIVLPQGIVNWTIGAGNEQFRIPMDFYWKNGLYETIFLASEIYLNGEIDGIALYNNFVSNTVMAKPTKIWLGETTQTNLADAWIPSTQLTLVFDGTVNYPAGQNTINIIFPTPYQYNGGNLVMMVQRPMDTVIYNSADNLYGQTVGTNRSRRLYSDTTTFDPANPTNTGVVISGRFPKTTFYIVTENMGSISGTVTSGGAPLAGAVVALEGTTFTYTTGADGTYSFPYVFEGQRQLTCTKAGYLSQTQTVTVVEDQNAVLDFNMIFIPQLNVTGIVLGNDAPGGLEGAVITVVGNDTYTATTNAQGAFTVTGIWGYADYTYTIARTGYGQISGNFALTGTDMDLGTLTLNENAYPVTNLQAVEVSSLVALSWTSPGPIPAGWVRWDSGLNDDSIGTGGAAEFTIASRWPLENLFDFVGQSLYAVEFWPAQAAATYTIRVWTGGSPTNPGTLATEQVVTTPTIDAFNVVVLDNPVAIPLGEELWFGVHVNTTTGYPAGCDAGPAHDGLGNMMYFQGAWTTLLALAPTLNYDWNLGGYIGYSAPAVRSMQQVAFEKPVIRSGDGNLSTSGVRSLFNNVSHNLPRDDRSLQGFKVWRLNQGQEENEQAWTLLTPDMITSTTYSDTGWDQVPTGNYKWAVKALYTNDVISPATLSNAIYHTDIEGETVLPLVTALAGNYPNPFNPETVISYSVKNSTPVVLDIYNTRGQRIKTLVNETKASGNYTVKWDGTDENGQKVSSGVYFYKMNAGKYSSSKKMILMK